jgi:hypothetical protein
LPNPLPWRVERVTPLDFQEKLPPLPICAGLPAVKSAMTPSVSVAKKHNVHPHKKQPFERRLSLIRAFPTTGLNIV